MLRAPDVYHVGVARAPWEESFGRAVGAVSPYLGPPEENPAAYEAADNTALADRLVGNLLIITRTADINTPFAITMRLMDAFVSAGRSIDLLVLPGAAHAVSGPARDYEMAAVRRYFDLHLRGTP
jgi:dipeptidyl-peptidase 4